MTDRLDEAIVAFRAEQDAERGDARAARRRLLRSARARELRRRTSIALAIALALVVSNSTTWAWATGRLDAPLARLFDALEGPPERAAASEVPIATRSREPDAPERALPSVIEPTGAPSPSAEPSLGPVLAHAPSTPRHPTPRITPSEPRADAPAQIVDLDPLTSALDGLEPLDPEEPSADPDRIAFGDAHRAHFGGGSAASALASWDDYLGRFPEGRFVPEARFNRAIALLRSRRDDEARQALRPFAEGAYDGLRAREAQALLDALERQALRR